jgi:putative PEP-CTERM system histidine kinase
VTGNAFAAASMWSFGLAAAGYLLLAGRMALGLKRSRHGSLLFVAVLATAAWSCAGALFGYSGTSRALVTANALDTLRYAVWYVFMASFLAGAAAGGASAALPRWSIGMAGVLVVASVALLDGWPLARELELDKRLQFGIRLGMAIMGLVFVEQLYRGVHPQARWSVKPLTLAIAAAFGYDLYMYAEALLFSGLDADIWAARGAANALLIPFIAIATARNKDWTIEIHLSRDAVFHSTALLISGVFLLAVAGAGYIVRYTGGEWGRALQIELFFAAAVFVALIATSGRFRSRLRVFVSKHFFSYRYDYREEWLRFTRTLSTDSTVLRTQERAILALADLVESPAGALWLAEETKGFVPAARLNMPPVEGSAARDDPLPAFLERTGWVITVPEVIAHPDRYPGLSLPPWLAALPDAWLVVPLSTGARLDGFAVLLTPRTPVEVDWEVRDVVKAAARAAAAYLQQLRVTEALLESRKFDAFNRMSAFVVHDLKNLVAQLSLMLRNAERHRDNPEFQRDMLDTVANVVSRMNALMLQLRTGSTPVESPRPVELAPIVRRVCEAKSVRPGAIRLRLADGVQALGHEERLEHVIGHLVQNAVDATAGGGEIAVSIGCEEGYAVVEVADTGVGMSAEFQRDRLFKPFETTKSAGMGIGIYESRQYVVGLGGRILVDSGEGQGTRVRVLLPQADGTRAPTQSLKEAA